MSTPHASRNGWWSLVPMTDGDLAAFLLRSRADYVADLIADGMDARAAADQADGQLTLAFRTGRPAPGHEVFDVVDDRWWLWDIEMVEAERNIVAHRLGATAGYVPSDPGWRKALAPPAGGA